MVNYRLLSLLMVPSALAVPWLLTTLGCCPYFLVGIANKLRATDFLTQVENGWRFIYPFGAKAKSSNDHRPPSSSASPHSSDPAAASGVFTKSELSKYTGEQQHKPATIYLAVLGHVFDVSSGWRFYGPANTYSVFSGRDASGAFVTGDFTEKGLTDDIEDFTGDQLNSIRAWVDYFKKNYKHIGYVSGKFYTKDGRPMAVLERINAKIAEFVKQQETDKLRTSGTPPCNMESNLKTGTRVWCSQKSGGVLRSWVGVPRLMYQPGDSMLSCVCVQPSSLAEDGGSGAAKFREYPGCELTATSCNVPDTLTMDSLQQAS